MRELVKMTESMPAAARRLSAFGGEVRDSQDAASFGNIRLRLERLVGGQCGGFGGGQASHGVHESTLFKRPLSLERREAPGKCSLLLSEESVCPELLGSHRMEDILAKFLKTTAPSCNLMCRVGGVLAAVLTWAMFEAYLRPGEMLSLKPSSFLAPTEGGVRSWVILPFPQTGTASSKTGEADEPTSLDWKRCLWMEPVFEKLQPQDKPLLNLNYAEYLVFSVVLPQIRR